MRPEFITYTAAIEHLQQAIERAGGTGAYAKSVGVSKAFVSQMTHAKRNITGKVAADLGLKAVYGYELTRVKSSPEQEQYENSRRAWLEQNEIDYKSMNGIKRTRS